MGVRCSLLFHVNLMYLPCRSASPRCSAPSEGCPVAFHQPCRCNLLHQYFFVLPSLIRMMFTPFCVVLARRPCKSKQQPDWLASIIPESTDVFMLTFLDNTKIHCVWLSCPIAMPSSPVVNCRATGVAESAIWPSAENEAYFLAPKLNR